MVFTIYTAPLQARPLRAWKQKSASYRHGFVLRIFWLGIVFRAGRRATADDFDAL